MSRLSQPLFLGAIYMVLTCVYTDFQQLSAYVVIPRSTSDTTDRMNAGGDPPDRAGLIDMQRSPEYVDDWWGRNDYYYSEYGIRKTHRIRHPEYNTYYPLPNPYYPPDSSDYYNSGRYYRPGYPR